MRYATVCSGAEACSLAWEPLGWQPVFFSEIDRFTNAVLKSRWPNVPNLGDMEKIDGARYRGAVDIICGGTPCQSNSYAGSRGGMDDPRGILALQHVEISAGASAPWFLWENVAGALTVNGGADFARLIRRLGERGYGVAWRVFNAGHFGVPQHRRRVIVVGYLGDWRRAAAVLFDRAPDKVVREKGIWVPCLDASGLVKKQTMPERGRCWTVHDGQGHRFLTPEECERLQGFPVGHTDIIYRGRPAPDTQRYKAIGNSMPVPLMKWLGRRIQTVNQMEDQNV